MKALGIPDLNVDKWNKGKQKFALLHPASGGHGLNLQHGGSVMVWFSPIYSLELYQQAVARLYRQGQTKSVRNYRIIMKGSVDEDILNVLSGKKHAQDCLLSALRR
jgi:SNF2 family DNA or RNA helicase